MKARELLAHRVRYRVGDCVFFVSELDFLPPPEKRCKVKVVANTERHTTRCFVGKKSWSRALPENTESRSTFFLASLFISVSRRKKIQRAR